MSEMIERVALAICGDDNPDNILAIHRDRARAAIKAMRKPTEAMVMAARGSAPYDRDVDETWPIMIDEALK